MKCCSQCKIFYNTQLSREKEKNMKLNNESNDAKNEIKRLKIQLQKMNQRQAKTILYYDTIMYLFSNIRSDLQALNQEYRKKIESYQPMKERSKKMNVSQSKSLNRSFTSNVLFKSTFQKYKQEDKQNVNFLNQPEAKCCQKIQCTSKIQLNQSRKLLQEIINQLHNLSFTINHLSKGPETIEDYEIWAKRLQQEQNMRKKRFLSNSPLQILKHIQENINIMREKSENNDNPSRKSTNIFEAITSLKSKQKSLLDIPFLEKIQLQSLKEDTNCFIQSANQIKRSILSKLSKQTTF